jgi:hypothetical protein
MSKFRATFSGPEGREITLLFPSRNWNTAGEAAWTAFDLEQASRDGWQLTALDIVVG